MKKTYENGYLPKIAYHFAAGNKDKATYFYKKQTEVYGLVTVEQMVWINDKVEAIKKQWAVEEKEMNDHLGYIS